MASRSGMMEQAAPTTTRVGDTVSLGRNTENASGIAGCVKAEHISGSSSLPGSSPPLSCFGAAPDWRVVYLSPELNFIRGVGQSAAIVELTAGGYADSGYFFRVIYLVVDCV